MPPKVDALDVTPELRIRLEYDEAGRPVKALYSAGSGYEKWITKEVEAAIRAHARRVDLLTAWLAQYRSQ